MKTTRVFTFLTAALILLLSACTGRQSQEGTGDVPADVQEAAILSHHQALGDSLVMLAQAELLRNVSEAMKEGGPPNAVEFCAIHAPGIVTDLAESWNCEIRRTSMNYRNPDNQPSEDEIKILGWYTGLGDSTLTSTVWRDEGLIHYASPIKVAMPACLKCHGIPGQEIDDATFALIQENYPEDKATGYAMGDFRGMWHLTFEPED